MKRNLFLVMLVMLLAVALAQTSNSTKRANSQLIKPPQEEIPILMYHKINPSWKAGGLGLRVSPKDFEQQLQYLKEHNYNSITLAQLADHYEFDTPLPNHPIVLTFDDGYLDNYTYAFPLLKKYQFIGTIFLVSDLVGKTNHWDEVMGRPSNALMKWPQIREMEKYGIEFGAHTVTHPHLGRIPVDQARREIVQSKIKLEKQLRHPVETFCYPYGSYNPRIVQIVSETGFKAATTVKLGRTTSTDNLFKLNRIRVTGRYSLTQFAANLVKPYLTKMPRTRKKPPSL